MKPGWLRPGLVEHRNSDGQGAGVNMEQSTKNPTGMVLLVDDDPGLIEGFRFALEDVGHNVVTAMDAEEARTQCARCDFAVCLLDVSLGADSGLELLPQLREMAPEMRVMMVSAESELETAFTAFERGAVDYLVKPCSPEQLQIAVARQLELRRLTVRVESLERQVSQPGDEDLETASAAMRTAVELAKQVADTNANVLILGENGTGKGVLARAIHRWSQRAAGALVTVNCPSLSADLLESELFGHNKGAFTGAVQANAGRVAQAAGGTLFLDEIGDFPLSLQPKLLRFIQDKEYERVGDPVTRKADVRLLAATNANLAEMSRDGRFRQDLYYRLNVISITMPALRERREDIADLALRLLRRFALDYGRPARGFSDEAITLMQRHDWPGNVRELQNAVERAVILSPGDTISAEQLGLSPDSAGADATGLIGTDISLEELERIHLTSVLARADTLDSAARILGIDASTLYRKRKAYGLT